MLSIRLDELRRGSQDYEYFWLLSHKKGGRAVADSIANGVIHEHMGLRAAWGLPGMWSHNAEEWERDRYRMGDLITTIPDSQPIAASPK